MRLFALIGSGCLAALVRGDSSYSDADARVYAKYSSMAYASPAKIRLWRTTSACADTLSGFEVKGTYEEPTSSLPFSNNAGFGYIGVDAGRSTIVAAFKGSNDTADWIEDFTGGEFDFTHCTMPSGESVGTVHAGFCEYYVDLANQGMVADLVSLAEQYPDYTVVTTGHSLGAAAAVLLAYDFYGVSGGKMPLVYTFGLPRVADHEFSVEFATRVLGSYRVVHNRDIVPHLPVCCGVTSCWTSSSCPYHVANEIFYKEDMSDGADYTVCDGTGEDMSCSDGQVDMSADDHCSYFGDICGECA